MLREKRKFTPTEDRILAYLTAPKNTGDLVNHLCPANLVVIHRSLDRLEKEGWIKPHPGYDFVPVPGKNWPDVIFLEPRGQYWQQANNDPAAAYY